MTPISNEDQKRVQAGLRGSHSPRRRDAHRSRVNAKYSREYISADRLLERFSTTYRLGLNNGSLSRNAESVASNWATSAKRSPQSAEKERHGRCRYHLFAHFPPQRVEPIAVIPGEHRSRSMRAPPDRRCLAFRARKGRPSRENAEATADSSDDRGICSESSPSESPFARARSERARPGSGQVGRDPSDLVVDEEIDVLHMRARIGPIVGIDPRVPANASVAVDRMEHIVGPLRENQVGPESRIIHQMRSQPRMVEKRGAEQGGVR